MDTPEIQRLAHDAKGYLDQYQGYVIGKLGPDDVIEQFTGELVNTLEEILQLTEAQTMFTHSAGNIEVYETGSAFYITHKPTGKVACMGDGVGMFEGIDVGTTSFYVQLAADLDASYREYEEAYFNVDEKVKLYDLEGFARISGKDEQGNQWIQYELEEGYLDDETGEIHGDICSICGVEMWAGWVCLDGGEVVCDKHIDLDIEELEELRK